MRTRTVGSVTQHAASLPGSMTDQRTCELSTLHIRFDSHSLAVDSTVHEVATAFVSIVSPMIALAPKGKSAGAFSVLQGDAGIVVRGSDGPDKSFQDPKVAARELYHRAVKALIDARPDLLWLHAGAMSLGEQAILLCAPSGHGKSTLVGELLRWEWSYLSDEVAPIDPISAKVLPLPLSPAKRVGGQRSVAARDVQTLEKSRSTCSPAWSASFPAGSVTFTSSDTRRKAHQSPSPTVLQRLQSSSCCATPSTLKSCVTSRFSACAG